MAGVQDIWQTLQNLQQSVSAIGKTLAAGLTVNATPAVYTVASLPATGANGQWAFASNGRKPGEGAGSGTGVPVFFNGATGTWFSYCSGTAVAA